MDLSQIQKRISAIEKTEKEIKDAREMLKSELENDEQYLKVIEEVNEVVAKRKRIKEEILAKGPNQKLSGEIKNNTEEVGLLKEILSAELMQVYQENQSDEIVDADGTQRKFKVIVKLMPKNYQKRDGIGQYAS